MENVGGTFEWSRKQIVAYAGAFNEGDAINVDGVGWVEVTSRKDAHGDFLEAGELNDFKLSIDGVGVHRGFISPKGRYLVTTLKDYEVQEGDKLVWLGKTPKQGKRSELTFGKAYNVAEVISGQGVSYEVDDGWCRLVIPSSVRDWGVIPKWENVKEEDCVKEKTELAESIERTSEFQKGDKVTYVRKDSEDSPLVVGREGIVDGISEYNEDKPYRVRFRGYVEDYYENFSATELDRGWLFEVGERVRSTNKHLFNKEEGVIVHVSEGVASPMYTVSFGGDEELQFKGYNLERVEKAEESPEQQAFGLIVDFHDQHEVCGRLKVEVDKIAATALEHNDYDTVRRAIDISEKLEERTK